MDIQNSNVTIQLNAKDLSGKVLRVADCDVFIVHVFTDDPRNYLVFSKRDMLMTEFVDELTVPAYQMNNLKSGVVQYTYHYLPKNHDCIHEQCYSAPEFEEDEVEQTGAYHPHHHHGHREEQLIHSRPVVTSIYWRNLHHHHPEKPLNNVTLFDVERLHRLIEKERVDRAADIADIKAEYGEKYTEILNTEIERSTAEDEKINAEIEEIKATLSNADEEKKETDEKVNSDITQNHNDITAEVARATQKEIELEQMIQGEVSRAKSVEEVIDTKITMEKERAQSNESNINDRVVSVTDRFDAFKSLATERIDGEIARAKATEASLNDRISGVVKDLADEVSRAAQKDIEHTNLVVTETNRAEAVENKIATDLETEVNRAKDAEKHILDEVHTLQDNVSSLATATNVYTKAEVDTKISSVNDEIATVNNWINNHTDNTDELKTKVANLVEDVDKAKADILAEVAKCDAENNKLATELATLSEATYTKAEVDNKVSEVKTEIATEIADRANADTTLQTSIDVVTGKVDAEVERAKSVETAINDEIANIKATVNEKATANGDAVAEVAADLVKEVARAKAEEKVLSDAIEMINGDNATAGSIKKSLADAKDYTDAEIAKNNLAKATELNDTLNNYATKTDVDKKISDVIGTAPEALDTLGKISDALNGESDAISAINGVLAGKANSEDVYTKAEVDTKVSTVENVISTLETKVDNADSAINSRIDDLSAKVNNNNKTALDIFNAHNDKIDAEELARKDADKAINDKFDAKVDELNTKISDVNAALIADIAKSDAKDIELEAKISANTEALATEVARAKEVEKELNDKINNLDVAGTNTAVATLEAKITQAIADSTAKDTEIETAIANEKSRAENAEKAINDKLDILNSADSELVGSLAHAIHDANHYTDDEIAKVKSELDIHKAEAEAVYAKQTDVYDKSQIDAIIEVANSKINSKLPIDSFNEWSAGVAMKSEIQPLVDNAVAESDKFGELDDKITANAGNIADVAQTVAEVSDNLEAEVERAKAAEKEIFDTIENVSETFETAIEELNNIFNGGGEGEGGNANAIVTKADLDETLDDYYTKSEITDVLTDSLSDVYTKTQSDEKYCTKSQAEAAAAVKANDVKVQMESRIATLEAIDHDAYLTSHQSLANYYTKSEANNTFLQGVAMSQSEYDALTEKDENVLYIII